MATLTDTVPNITYPDAPVITTVTGDTFDVQMESYDSSLVEYTGQVTYLLEKTSSQSSLDFSGSTEAYSLDSNNVLDSSLVEYTGQLTGYQIKTSSQSSLDFSGSAAIEPTMNTLTQDIAFTGQLTATIVKVSSAVPPIDSNYCKSEFRSSINWFYTCIKFIWRRYWSINRKRCSTRR